MKITIPALALPLTLSALGCAFSLPLAADEIRRIVHPDGRVEYTNVAPEKADQRLSGGGRSETIYKYRRADGVLAYTDQRPLHIRDYEVLKFDCYACSPVSTVNWHTTPLNRKAFRDNVIDAAQTFDVDPALVRAVIHAESAFRPDALSSKGAMGLMQLMPETAKELGVTDALNEEQNIHGGVRYLATLLDRYDGDSRLATAAYNAGPGAISKYGGIPPYAETRAYVDRVAILRSRYAKAE